MPALPPHPPFQARIDVVPKVLEFISALSPDDIVTELVQNDLDQGARSTRIRFADDALIAEGNGRPVDPAGWKRLSYLLAAGGEVEAKQDGIGVKNHGLRSCFALGDDIIVRSAGQRALLTLCTPEERRRVLRPGAWVHPMPDEGAPATGARIEVPLRTRRLPRDAKTDTGLVVPTAQEVERLFRIAVSEGPHRFLGCVRPGVTTRYVLTLEHWRLGSCVLSYTCGPLRQRGRLRVFRRRCTAALPDGTTTVREEEAVLFQPRLSGLGRVPRFYRGVSGPVCEISWAIGHSGRPRGEPGRFRYPIAYAADAADARTEVGASFSAPFVSDSTRHGLAAGVKSQNEPLVAACEEALVRVLREYLVPTYGIPALSVLEDPQRRGSERCTRLVLAAAQAGALPASARSGRGRQKGTAHRPGTVCVPGARAGKRSFLVPAFRSQINGSSEPLETLAPAGYAHLHPDVPAFVRTLLVARRPNEGEGLPYLTFDETDVVARFCGRTTGAHPWGSVDEWRRDVADPERARLYLDALARGFKGGTLGSVHADDIRKHGLLPDRDGTPRPWSQLCRERDEIPEIPGVAVQPSIHPVLVDHTVVASRIKIEPFKLSSYLAHSNFATAPEETRAQFFTWLHKNSGRVSLEAMVALAAQPIWPTAGGSFVVFEELCAAAQALRRVLADVVHLPAPTVRTFRGVRTDGRGRLRLRTRPRGPELRAWWDAAMASFPRDRALDRGEAVAWRRLEHDVARLRADAAIRAEMPWLGLDTPALAGDRWLRPIGSLHLAGGAVDACALLPGDMLAGAIAELHPALGARTRPSAEALVRALAEDAANAGALHPRLAALDAARRANDTPKADVSAIAFLPVGGRLYAPRQVSLRGSPDYWGAWRVPLALDGAMVDRQTHLVALGVAGRTPTVETSVAFFHWLAVQPESVLKAHLDQVIRHLLNKHGPLQWWDKHPTLPCLPVYAYRREVRLISRRDALSPRYPALLPDFEALEREVLDRDRRRYIAIVETSRVTGSAFGQLRESGLQSLRGLAGPTVAVRTETTTGGRRDEGLTERLRVVASERFGSVFKKRLQEMHLPGEVVRHQWLHQVRALDEVRVVPGLQACFRLGKEDYWLRVDSAADVERKVLWISADAPSAMEAFFAALAERVFEPGSPPYLAYALQAAVAAGYVVRFDSPGQAEQEVEGEPGRAGAADEDQAGRSTDVRQSHSLGQADQMPNAPDPAPLPAPGPGGVTFSRRKRRGGASRPESTEERAATDELKEKHYAWHCQVCLASAGPLRLAPRGTYAYRPLHRRSFMVGHHVDPIHGEGVRWVSNMLILCDYHHRQLGDRLEHAAIGAALRAGEARQVDFEDPDGAGVRVEGTVAQVQLDSEPFQVSVFFTSEHAESWLTA